jgi:glycosyltransferase involved in cell wall biosynthesis
MELKRRRNETAGPRKGGLLSLAVVIPCYDEASHIEAVIGSLPPWVTHIVAVDDGSRDATASILSRLERREPRLQVVTHPANRGLGAAMVSGFGLCLKLGVDVVAKIDGDGQMDPCYLPHLLQPLLEGRVPYAKGNRFRHVHDLGAMPWPRLLGNIALTFMTKLATGYWELFDAQNGYVAIRREALERIPLDRIDTQYCFENSMLAWLNLEDAPVVDVPMPARYGDEVSAMRLPRVLISFPFKLGNMFLRRIFLKHFVYKMSPVALYLIPGLVMMLFGGIFGAAHWWISYRTSIPATTGTVVTALLPFLMGFHLTLQGFHYDITTAPEPATPRREVPLEDVPKYFAAASARREACNA